MRAEAATEQIRSGQVRGQQTPGAVAWLLSASHSIRHWTRCPGLGATAAFVDGRLCLLPVMRHMFVRKLTYGINHLYWQLGCFLMAEFYNVHGPESSGQDQPLTSTAAATVVC